MDAAPPKPVTASYRAVLAHTGIARIVISMLLARTADAMWQIVIVLFALAHYHSPLVAGIAAAAGQIPNKFLAPVVGTLLDRHGRRRLVQIDYAIGSASIGLIGGLGLTGHLAEWGFIVLATVAGLTTILSATGLRSLFPLLLPRRMWDHGNGLDSASYLASALVGPALGGLLAVVRGGEVAALVIAVLYAGGVVAAARIPDPPSSVPADESLWQGAWRGVVYVVRNPTLSRLAIVLSLINVGMGTLFVALPYVVITQMHGSSALIGLLFAVMSIAGLISGAVTGSRGGEGRERLLLGAGSLLFAAALVGVAVVRSVPLMVAVMVLLGAANGPVDIGLFGLRQRRTDPAMLGRVMAVTMAFNGAGNPVGSLAGGALVRVSAPLTFGIAAALALLGAAMTATIPRHGDSTPTTSDDPGAA